MAIGTSSTFDIFVEALGQSESITGYNFALNVTGPGPNPFTFTGVTRETNLALAPQGYVLVSPIAGGPIENTVPPYEFQYLDADLTSVRTTTAGDVYGAGRISFMVATNATPGDYEISFDFGTDPLFPTTAYTTPGGEIPRSRTTYVSGTISVIDPAAVPEPSTTLLLALTGVVGFAAKRYRRKRHDATTAA